ncbi:MAG TPA: TIGR03619 family F420-dependent LLM class oxidoreductase [Dehalococcoidia bacterium]|nr:TIGR03619 family F420-dependent LLM class oxidoreductase [Dehalococcoidia bacterium]
MTARASAAPRELGAQLPAWHWDLEVSELRDWAQGVEAIGYDWLGITDHVLYAYDSPSRPQAVYPGGTIQHEPLTFLAWVAGFTNRVALTTSVIVLPQRQAILVAKQAAEVDLLSGGRLRLGLGSGWQESEYEALGKEFHDRGRRLEDDVAIMRACWSDEPIDYESDEVKLEQMSVLPKPIQPGGPPLLFGGLAPRAIDRAARLGDGWIAMTAFRPDAAPELVGKMHDALAAQGRQADSFPLQATTPLITDLGALREVLGAYTAAGVNRLGLHLPGFRREDRIPVDEYLRQLEVIWREVWPEFQ